MSVQTHIQARAHMHTYARASMHTPYMHTLNSRFHAGFSFVIIAIISNTFFN